MVEVVTQTATHPVEKPQSEADIIAAGAATVTHIPPEVAAAGVTATGDQVHAAEVAQIAPITIVGENTPSHDLVGTGVASKTNEIFPGPFVLSGGDGTAAQAEAKRRKGLLRFTGPNKQPFTQEAQSPGILESIAMGIGNILPFKRKATELKKAA